MDILQWEDNAERLAHALLENINYTQIIGNSRNINIETIVSVCLRNRLIRGNNKVPKYW